MVTHVCMKAPPGGLSDKDPLGFVADDARPKDPDDRPPPIEDDNDYDGQQDRALDIDGFCFPEDDSEETSWWDEPEEFE